MNLVFTNSTRRKAVWGPKRTVLAALMALGIAAPAGAAGDHHHQGPKAKPGRPNHFAKNYKLDDELEGRSKDKNGSLRTTKVIVTLVPGADVPPQFKQFTRGDRFDIINGQ